MLFEKYIVNTFKKQMYSRCDDTGVAYYFSADDFDGLNPSFSITRRLLKLPS